MALTLTPQDKLSPLGQKMAEYFQSRLASLRVQNDKEMPESERAVLLAQIKEVKALHHLFSRESIVNLTAAQ